MARESREPASDELHAFELALQNAHNDLWWRQFIRLIKGKRQSYLETLATQRQDMRTEDTIRGQISELTWLLSLDEVGGRELERRQGNGNEPAQRESAI